MSRVRIGLVAQTPLSDRWAGSGIPFAVARAVQDHVGEVVELGPFPVPHSPIVREVLGKAERAVTGRYKRWKSSTECCQIMADDVASSLIDEHCDVILAVRALWAVARLESDRPVYSFNDATLLAMRRMRGYEYADSMAEHSVVESVKNEGRAFTSAAGVLFSSQWAAESAVADYGVAREKVFVTPNGANLLREEVPPRSTVINRTRGETCKLLFVGRDWKRKGGALAVEATRLLNERGFPASLTVVGCVPPAEDTAEFVKVVKLLDKNEPKDAARLRGLYLTSDFFVLPTRSETFGTVFAEAAAFGLPSVALDVGGVSQAIQSGVNGVLLSEDASAEDLAEAVAAVFRDAVAYRRLVNSARDSFDTRLNWDRWGEDLGGIFRQTLPADLARRVRPR